MGFDLVVTLFSGLWVLICPVYAVILRALCYRSVTRGTNRYEPEPSMVGWAETWPRECPLGQDDVV